MKAYVNTIIYFSATGSGKKIAEFLADKFSAVTINLSDTDERKIYNVCGNCLFVLPVYNGAIPAVCAEYIKHLDGGGKHAYVVCVYGGVYRGKALQNAAGLLKKSKFVPVRGAYIAAPHTYCKKKINQLDDKRLILIYEYLFDNDTGNKLKISAKPKGWEKQAVFKKLTGKCVVNRKCNGCGQCKKVCPVNAIGCDYKSNKDCILCEACVKVCTCNARHIKFFTPLPAVFINLNCKTREDMFFTFV
ncbi:MAG: EFR1 family ferrodoxin [Clostridia bacterium]|nr:EFR1 family ferrodoxin [Clostridia bacterium]